MTGDINDLYVWKWQNSEDLYGEGMTFRPRGWLCDDFSTDGLP